jgi:hypothetical protein
MAIRHAAFDESGKADREKVIFAGLISTPQEWFSLNQKWIALLAPHGLQYWRTSDAARLKGPCERFRGHREELRTLTRELANVICEHAEGGTIHIITMDLYNALSPEKKAILKDPYYAAFDEGLMALAFGPHSNADDTLTLVADDSDEYSKEAVTRYRRFKQLHQENARMIAGFCLHDDKAYPPLQAADLFAYCQRRRAEGTLNGIWAEVMTKFDETFTDIARADITA